MTDTFVLLTSSMPNDRQRIRQIKYHINQLLSELRVIEADTCMAPMNISLNSQLTSISREENCCPFLSHKPKSAILHSTTNHEHRKKPNKFLFALSARATSTPKSSPQQQQRLVLKPHQTSTPRRSKRHSTALPIPANNMIPLKRLLYNKKDRDQHKRRHSAVPFSKRSILPRLQPIDENPQWI